MNGTIKELTTWKYSKAEHARRYDAMIRAYDEMLEIGALTYGFSNEWDCNRLMDIANQWLVYGNKQYKPARLTDYSPCVGEDNRELGKLHDALLAKLDKAGFDHKTRMDGIGQSNILAEGKHHRKSDGKLLATQSADIDGFIVAIKAAGKSLAPRYAKHTISDSVKARQERARCQNRRIRAQRLYDACRFHFRRGENHHIPSGPVIELPAETPTAIAIETREYTLDDGTTFTMRFEPMSISAPELATVTNSSKTGNAPATPQSVDGVSMPAVSITSACIWLAYPTAPDAITRAELKNAGFRWSDKRKAWWIKSGIREAQNANMPAPSTYEENMPTKEHKIDTMTMIEDRRQLGVLIDAMWKENAATEKARFNFESKYGRFHLRNTDREFKAWERHTTKLRARYDEVCAFADAHNINAKPMPPELLPATSGARNG